MQIQKQVHVCFAVNSELLYKMFSIIILRHSCEVEPIVPIVFTVKSVGNLTAFLDIHVPPIVFRGVCAN